MSDDDKGHPDLHEEGPLSRKQAAHFTQVISTRRMPAGPHGRALQSDTALDRCRCRAPKRLQKQCTAALQRERTEGVVNMPLYRARDLSVEGRPATARVKLCLRPAHKGACERVSCVQAWLPVAVTPACNCPSEGTAQIRGDCLRVQVCATACSTHNDSVSPTACMRGDAAKGRYKPFMLKVVCTCTLVHAVCLVLVVLPSASGLCALLPQDAVLHQAATCWSARGDRGQVMVMGSHTVHIRR